MIAATALAAGHRLPDQLLHVIGWPKPDAQAGVVLFVRGAWCPVCRRQISRFAASADELAALGVPLIIISTGSTEDFASDARLGSLSVTYVSDPGGDVVTALGIAAEHPDHGVIARPSTVVIDPAGFIHYAHVGTHSRDRPEPPAILLAVRRILGVD
jgi:peroxiredoxin